MKSVKVQGKYLLYLCEVLNKTHSRLQLLMSALICFGLMEIDEMNIAQLVIRKTITIMKIVPFNI